MSCIETLSWSDELPGEVLECTSEWSLDLAAEGVVEVHECMCDVVSDSALKSDLCAVVVGPGLVMDTTCDAVCVCGSRRLVCFERSDCVMEVSTVYSGKCDSCPPDVPL